MAIFNFQILLYSPLSLFFCFLFPQTHSLSFKLTNIGPQHQNVNIKTFQEANITSQGLQLTPNEENLSLRYRAGKAIYIDRLHLWDKSTEKLTDFETHFVFVIDSKGSSEFADGLTFFLADPNESDTTVGHAMGLPVNRDTLMRTSNFVAVEFDTYLNGPPVDPFSINPRTHVGINVNSIISNVTAVWHCDVTHGIQNEAWIRYNSSSHNLSVVFTGSTNSTRVNDTIHLVMNLMDHLPEWVTFGFSAATGELVQKNSVISWEFSSTLQINDPRLPLGALVGIVVGPLVLVGGLGLVGFGLWKRSRANEKDEFEVEISMENEFEAGKASKESDVYSFGVVALEIACGRKPFDLKVPESQMRLVEWVWNLYGMGRLLEAMDAKLGTDFDEQETVRLMIVGLWCAHPNHNVRPKIRQVIHVLNFEAPVTILPPKQPTLSFFPPPTTSSNTSQNQYSSYAYNTASSKFTSSSTASSPSTPLLNNDQMQSLSSSCNNEHVSSKIVAMFPHENNPFYLFGILNLSYVNVIADENNNKKENNGRGNFQNSSSGKELARGFFLESCLDCSLDDRALQAALPFFSHAILLDWAFAHCPRFTTVARSPGRVSVPVWLII
ncbi:hypothetical protein Vadar_017276 [Vaccinium darrowii]|uniref:Uncharacterized protein n=1 Tax=Vaccinium darrowii TaxID=229202 RepID=A0ACB7X1J1_9ERIC|nr:hypothetical protein Vadar_017276 [Vaccinium darrowii]